jgi:hypothetical protein
MTAILFSLFLSSIVTFLAWVVAKKTTDDTAPISISELFLSNEELRKMNQKSRNKAIFFSFLFGFLFFLIIFSSSSTLDNENKSVKIEKAP